MASLLGSSVRLDCPACDEPVTVPVRQLDLVDNTVSLALDLRAFREHIADRHTTHAEAAKPPT